MRRGRYLSRSGERNLEGVVLKRPQFEEKDPNRGDQSQGKGQSRKGLSEKNVSGVGEKGKRIHSPREKSGKGVFHLALGGGGRRKKNSLIVEKKKKQLGLTIKNSREVNEKEEKNLSKEGRRFSKGGTQIILSRGHEKKRVLLSKRGRVCL